jgi:hypothetical protein
MHLLHATRLLLPVLAFTAGCSPQESDARIGSPRPPRADACDLVVVNAMSPTTFNSYEQVGVVRLSNVPAGTDPMDPSVRAIVRPRACALGGEAISVMASGDAVSRNGLRTTAYAAYVVWAKKRALSKGPEKF